MIPRFSHFALLAAGAGLAQAQAPPEVQSTGWNSTFKLTPEQLKLGNLTSAAASALEIMIDFDRSQLANGGPAEDDFYRVPTSGGSKPVGKTIKVEDFTDPKSWSIPAGTAMSRIIYTTTNLNGTKIPASAYVLWPYSPRQIKNGLFGRPSSAAPAVLWTHGTSGFYASGAPSTKRDLFYENFVPFALAQAGYAVIAPDYAGLGVGESWDGTFIPHQYLLREAGAGDALNAMRAALESFPERLTKDYVVMGHSQGGSVAWGLSEILGRRHHDYKDIAKGHLGTVTVSPPTDAIGGSSPAFLAWVAKDLDQVLTDFKLSDWFTQSGIDKIKLLNQIEGGQFPSFALFQPEEEVLQPDWRETAAISQFEQLANAGRLPFKGPMLVLQGEADQVVSYNSTKATVEATCKRQRGDLEFVSVPGAGHFPVMNAARQRWMQWIEERFEGRRVSKHGCGVETQLKTLVPVERYQALPNAYLQWAGQPQWGYELPTGA